MSDYLDLEAFKNMGDSMTTVFISSLLYCRKYKLPWKVLLTEKKKVVLSTIGWTSMHTHRFPFIMNKKFSYLSFDNSGRVAIYDKKDNHNIININVKEFDFFN